MNSVTVGTLHPHLREEEVRVVENAVRLAIESILNVLYGVSSARTNEYQRMVGDRDREIQRLESRLRELERGQQGARPPGCPCGAEPVRAEPGPPGCPCGAEPVRAEPGPVRAEPGPPGSAAPERSSERSTTVAGFERPPSISFQSNESSFPLSPSRRGLRWSGTPHSSESLSTSEAAVNVPTSPSSSAVKEEPCDIDTVFIQWDISQQEPEHQEDGDKTPTENQTLEHRGGSIRVAAPAPSDGRPFPQRQHQRMKRKSVPMSELPEEAQRLKRAAWRAASRRYYARKVARQQASSADVGPFCQGGALRCSQVQRRMLMQELPNDCGGLQRPAPPYGPPGISQTQREWPPEPPEPHGGGSCSVSGGILCS